MRSYTLTLTTADTVYKLDTLLKTANAAERGMFGRIKITSDTGNATAVVIGGSNLSTTAYGESLLAKESTTLSSGSGTNDQSTLGIYIMGLTTAGMKIHVALDEV